MGEVHEDPLIIAPQLVYQLHIAYTATVWTSEHKLWMNQIANSKKIKWKKEKTSQIAKEWKIYEFYLL